MVAFDILEHDLTLVNLAWLFELEWKPSIHSMTVGAVKSFLFVRAPRPGIDERIGNEKTLPPGLIVSHLAHARVTVADSSVKRESRSDSFKALRFVSWAETGSRNHGSKPTGLMSK